VRSRFGLPLHLPPQEEVPQHNRVIVELVVSGEDQCDRATPRHGPQLVEHFRMLVHLRSVAAAKFLPAGGIVSEPFPQRGAGSEILEPLIDSRVRFRDTSGPEPIDQYTRSVACSGVVVSSLQLDLPRVNCRAHDTTPE